MATEQGAVASDVVEDYFEEEEHQRQQQASAEVAITNTGQRTRLCCRVLLAAKERAHGAPDVTWACAWCLVSAECHTKAKFVIYHPLCEYCVS